MVSPLQDAPRPGVPPEVSGPPALLDRPTDQRVFVQRAPNFAPSEVLQRRKTRRLQGEPRYRYRDSNPGFRRERAFDHPAPSCKITHFQGKPELGGIAECPECSGDVRSWFGRLFSSRSWFRASQTNRQLGSCRAQATSAPGRDKSRSGEVWPSHWFVRGSLGHRAHSGPRSQASHGRPSPRIFSAAASRATAQLPNTTPTTLAAGHCPTARRCSACSPRRRAWVRDQS